MLKNVEVVNPFLAEKSVSATCSASSSDNARTHVISASVARSRSLS